MSSIVPTIGRKVWFWTAGIYGCSDTLQAFDATVVFVHPHGKVNLRVTNHAGTTFSLYNVPLSDPSTDDRHSAKYHDYATWMPYQVTNKPKEEFATKPTEQSPQQEPGQS